MKFIVDVKSIENIDCYKSYGIVVSTKLAALSDKVFSKEEIIHIINKAHELGKIVIIKIDKLLSEDEVEEALEYIEKIEENNPDYYMYSDMAFYNYFKKCNKISKLILNAPTIVASLNDAQEYKKLGINVVLSNELNISDIKTIVKSGNVVLNCFGYLPIFYSKRQLVTLYQEYSNIKENYHNKFLTLKEETREESYHIIENDNGTFITTPYLFLMFRELEFLDDALFLYINGIFIPENDLLNVCLLYNKAKENKTFENDEVTIKALNYEFGTSFMYLKPSILKEDE